MKLPQYVKNCIDKLDASGYSAYAVGGAVRDSLLGVEPSDWDVTTSATPDEILRVFEDERTIPTGIKHGTITLLADFDGKSVPIEITTYRIDGEYRDSRHPESVQFSKNIIDDLARRDFSVNAMAFNEKDGIIDAFGGRDDLAIGVIRAVGDPEKRFSEDALRILRAFRFSSQLGFEIEEKTLAGACACAPLLKNIARERIGVEMKKLLSSRGVVYSLTRMIECGVWNVLFEICAPDFSTVNSLSLLESDNSFARLSVLLEKCSELQRNAFLDSLRLSNAEKKLVCRLMSVKNFNVVGLDSGIIARRFLHLFGDVFDLALALFRFYNPQAFELFNSILSERTKKRALTLSSLAIKGSDLLPLCESDHKRVGLLLNELLERGIEDPSLNEKEILMEIAKNIK